MEKGKIPVRNIILLGHSHAGKTQLSEGILYHSGAISKPGKVEHGDTVSDYNDDEKQRKISINSSILSFKKGDIKINLIDTPGYNDFIGEVIAGIQACDGACVIVDAVSGIEIGTNMAFKLIDEHRHPLVVFINKIDKEHANFTRCLSSLKDRFNDRKVCAITYPLMKDGKFMALLNFIEKSEFDKIDDSEKENVKRLIDDLIENVAEGDDRLLEKYLDKGELSPDELKTGIKSALIQRKIIPVFAGSAVLDIGVKEFLNFILDYMPSPDEAEPREAVNISTNKNVKMDPHKILFTAQVFKTISDPYVGQISVFRIFSGQINSDSSIYNVSKKSNEKIGQLFTLLGKTQTQVASATSGDIVCVAKLKDTSTGDSLGSEKEPIKFSEFHFPEPAISFSIKPKTRSDEDKISNALHKLTAEDNTFRIVRDPQTKELIASGMGEFHINIMINRLKNRFGVQVDLGTPKIAYKETITTQGGSQYRHKKQTGGAGQFAEVWMRIEPLPRGAGFEFADEVVGGAIPAQFIVSCEKGIKTAMQEGVLAGYPMVDIKATVYDGKTHPVDSKDIAFQIAARNGFKEAVLRARPVLLEPIMDVEVTIPEEFMGDITGSLNSRRGRIMGMEPGSGMQIIKAKVPLEEMYKWANELKSITGGRGSYTMRFSHYEIVPSNIAQIIIEKAKKAKEGAKA